MTDRFGILSCRIPPIAVALSLAANLVWIPQALILADIVAAASIGTDAELTRLSPIMLASIFALLLVARSVAEVGAFAVSARTSVATKLDLRRKLIQAVLPWSPFDATRPPAGEIAALVVDQVETVDRVYHPVSDRPVQDGGGPCRNFRCDLVRELGSRGDTGDRWTGDPGFHGVDRGDSAGAQPPAIRRSGKLDRATARSPARSSDHPSMTERLTRSPEASIAAATRSSAPNRRFPSPHRSGAGWRPPGGWHDSYRADRSST
jgi:hypothetical protein